MYRVSGCSDGKDKYRRGVPPVEIGKVDWQNKNRKERRDEVRKL